MVRPGSCKTPGQSLTDCLITLKVHRVVMWIDFSRRHRLVRRVARRTLDGIWVSKLAMRLFTITVVLLVALSSTHVIGTSRTR